MRWFGVLVSFVMFYNSYGKGSIYFHFAKKRGCVKTLAHPLLYFTVLLYFLLAMLLFPHAFGNKLLYSNYIGL